jgi:hypothetical protein
LKVVLSVSVSTWGVCAVFVFIRHVERVELWLAELFIRIHVRVFCFCFDLFVRAWLADCAAVLRNFVCIQLLLGVLVLPFLNQYIGCFPF